MRLLRAFWFIIVLIVLAFSFTHDLYAAPVPSVALNVPVEAQIGEDFTFTVTFDNTDLADTGYGPIIDLILPFNGADGAAGADIPDGIDFLSATYLGAPVNAVVLTFPDDDGIGAGTTGCVNHPFLRESDLSPVRVCGTTGDKFVALELPFGSIVPSQPPAEIEINARMSRFADLGIPLTIQARGGFRFGASPVDNPCCDPPQMTTFTSAPIIPILLTIQKENNAPEGEVATGPNNVYQWTITVDVPNGQTVTDLDITDYLPDNVVVDLSSLITNPAGGTIAAAPVGGGPANPPNNRMVINFASITGGSTDSDIVITFDFYALYMDANGNPVIDATTGDDNPALNQMSAVGDWGPSDPRDGGGVDNASANGLCPTVCPGGNAPILMSIAGQKEGIVVPTGPLIPGTTVQYTITFQVSDFFAFGDVVITDTLSDGLLFDTAFTPQLSLTGAMTQFSQAPGAGGSTVLTFRITDETGAPLIGGCIPPGGTGGAIPDCGTFNNGATQGTLTYQASVRDEFLGAFPDPSVDHGDLLNNEMVIQGNILDVGDVTTDLGTSEDDDSDDLQEVARGVPQKSLYAVNGTACGACTGIRLAPGDTLTYHVRQEMPSSDFENFVLTDFVPLPVFNASELVTFSTTLDAAVPPAGTAKLLVPGDTLHVLTGAFPVMTTDAASNTVRFDFGSFDTPTNQQSFIDLLFTVTMNTEPIADELNLTNQVRAEEGSTNNVTAQNDAIIQATVTGPLLTASKGVVSSTSATGIYSPPTTGPVSFNPPGSAQSFQGVINSVGIGAQPINSDLGNVQIGDVITFAVVIENTGSSRDGAFDIRIRDVLPPGFVIPPGGLNLQVHLGSGTQIVHIPVGTTGTDADLFNTGIELIDPGLDTGACGPYSDTAGTNIIVITYDLLLQAPPQNVLENIVTVWNYSSGEGGTDHTGDQDISDRSLVFFGGSAGQTTTTTGTGGGDSGLITLTKQVDSPFALPGERVTWTINVANNSDTAVTNIIVSDNIPAGVEVLTTSTTRGAISLAGTAYTLTIDMLPARETAQFTIHAKLADDLQPPYIITNSASMLVGGTSVSTSSSSVMSVSTMPATGESSRGDLRPVMVALVLSGMILAGVGIKLLRA